MTKKKWIFMTLYVLFTSLFIFKRSLISSRKVLLICAVLSKCSVLLMTHLCDSFTKTMQGLNLGVISKVG